MSSSNRRVFIMSLAAGSSVLAAGAARAAAVVSESDAQAVALGYKINTKEVDQKKYPKHDVSQHCGDCQLYQGKRDDPKATGPCPIFGEKLVHQTGWCSAWVKKT